MRIPKALKWTGITIATLAAILIAWSVVVIAFGIKVDLSPFRGTVQSAASKALGRDLRIEGPVFLWPTAVPTIEVGRVRIANRKGWEPKDLVSLDRARLQLAVIPLLSGEISIGEISIEGLHLNLEATAEGENNWNLLSVDTERRPATTPQEPEEKPAADRPVTFVELEEVDVRDISVTYRDGGLDRSYMFRLDEFAGGLPEGQPITLSLAGSYQERPFAFSLKGAPLSDLLDEQKPWNLELAGNLADVPLRIKGVVYAETGGPQAGLEVALGRVDIGSVLQRWELVDGLEMAVERMQVTIEARGSNIYELLDESDFAFVLQGGEWVLHDPASGAGVPIRVVDGSIRATAGKPLAVEINGQLERTPVRIAVESDRLVAFAAPADRLPISATIEAAATRLKLSAEVALPIDRQDAKFGLSIAGERLDSLDELLGVSLPPWGPYSLGGRLRLTGQEYHITDFEVRVRDSDLHGDFNLKMSGERPRLDVTLRTETLQVNDFDVGDWSPDGDESAQSETPRPTPPGEVPAEGDEQPAFLLGPDVLGAFDAKLRVDVAQVLSGEDKLGSGNLVAAIKQGKFTVKPLKLNIPGGTLAVTFGYEPTATEAAVEASAKIQQFDYGVLARRIDPKTDMGGRLNLDLEIRTRAERLEDIFDDASGHLGFGVWPDEFEADLIELWAVNLMTALMPKLDDKPKSVVNCAVAWFDLKEGKLTEDRILIDTTRMQVTGEVEVNFKTEDVHMLLASYAKRPEFFSLETPIEVKGQFSDFKVGAASGAIVGTSVKFITSPVHVPLRRAFSKRTPKDGTAACSLAWERSPKDK